MTTRERERRARERAARLDAAISALAGLYDGGSLMASTDPAQLLERAVSEIKRARGGRSTKATIFPVVTCPDCGGTGGCRGRLPDGSYEDCCATCGGSGEVEHTDCDCPVCCQIVEDMERAEDAKKERTQCQTP